MKYYIISGEASGDMHGANLIAEMKKSQPNAEFRGWGGDKMEAQGLTLVKHYEELAFMGFAEVIMNLKTILNNIKFCKKTHKIDNTAFVVGNALSLPFLSESVDIVINIESSHAYPSMEKFLQETTRILKKGGHFLFADVRCADKIELLEDQLKTMHNMKIIETQDITENVFHALDSDHEQKEQYMNEQIHKWLIPCFREFIALKDSAVYNDLKKRDRIYKQYILQKI